ncbi:ThuA domain-containing protein [Micromonospora sp. DR5-3]|uniref:ThuA domain-containing protein n=1 Tax=unclassified Micromonospora TaxID=2617518 RepID=UPI0011D91A31|nr:MULTISPECIES: ThuA domain-containing protein [unclassified Micromonospora]MCW3816169.1 ThuA domain-containing protein [Micromonospora sp. DR5-3]TYC25139.1 carbohydrate-binding protein [Micromonospora sp. MP36]
MRRQRTLLFALLAAVALVLPSTAATAAESRTGTDFRVLVFSKVTNFYHDSIPAGVAAIQQLGDQHGFAVEATTDAAAFTDANLARFDALVFNNTNSTPASGDLLNADQRAALQKFIRDGGGWVGLHAASASERDWTWYEGLVGAIFDHHPDFSGTGGTFPGRIKVLDHAHPSTKNLPELWERSEEWYNWRTNPTGKVHTLAQIKVRDGIPGLDEGVDHAYSWCQNYDGGRSWFTAGGHSSSSFQEPAFLQHLLGGIKWAAGAAPGDCGATRTDNFERIPLVNQDLSDPFELAVAPDRRVFYIERTGALKVVNQDSLAVTTLLDFAYTPEQTSQSDGLLGMTLDRHFGTNNNWIYLLWSDRVEKQLNLSRFTVDGNSVSLDSEKRLLTIPTWRGEARANSHMGGSLTMDKQGNLYAAIGDNTDPFESSGFNPIDERAGRRAYDAQGTAGNTNDLRGKILRIKPLSNGGYAIPDGNLFAPGTARTKPEIYAMGMRNPFRITVDSKTNALLVADYGPDARSANPNRGPEGTVEFNRITSAGNYGWPYCIGNNTPFNDYDFATSTSGPKFDCAAPVNDSPNNTGLTNLPAAKPALVWYAYSASPQFPELGTGGGGPMSGPVYDYDPSNKRLTKFPQYFDGKWIVYELTRRWFKTLSIHSTAQTFNDPRFGPTNVGDLQSINGIFGNMSWIQPFEAEFGPDGSLYVIDFGAGSGSGRGGSNEGAGIYRIDYVANSRPPVAKLTVDKDSGPAPLTVAFSSAGTSGPDGTAVQYAWDFDGNGSVDSTAANPSHTYSTPGRFTARLTVTATNGQTAVAVQEITAGNTRPTVTLSVPDGAFFDFGDRIPYTVTVTDPEENSIDCAKVVVQTQLGHDSHTHPLDNYVGCTGVAVTESNGGDGHGPGQNLYTVLTAQYTDGGAAGAPALVGSTRVELQTKSKEAEHFDGQSGIQVIDRATASAGKRIGDIDNGDWIRFSPVNLRNVDSVTLGVASGSSGGDIEVRADSPTGELLGRATIAGTGGWDNLVSPTVELTDPGRTCTLYLVFVNPNQTGGTPDLMALDWLRFNGAGVREQTDATVSASATPTTGTAPLAVAFTGTASPAAGRSITDYAWDFGDNAAVAHGASTSHTYARKGTYTARLTVTDSLGATMSSSVVVTVR